MAQCRAMESNTTTTIPHTGSIAQPAHTENNASMYENTRQHLEGAPQHIDKQQTQ